MIFELSADRVGLNCWIERGGMLFMYMRENSGIRYGTQRNSTL